MVKDLRHLNQRGWDMTKIQANYLVEEQHLIRQIPLSFCGAQDYLTWTVSTNGIYIVKKGY